MTTAQATAQSDFDSVCDQFDARQQKRFKDAEAAAFAFAKAFIPFTKQHRLEVGGNIERRSGGFVVADLTLGANQFVSIPYSAYAEATVHTHPFGSDGLSGRLRYTDGHLDIGGGHGDYGVAWTLYKQDFYVFHINGRGWYFDYRRFKDAYEQARQSKQPVFAEWFTFPLKIE